MKLTEKQINIVSIAATIMAVSMYRIFPKSKPI